MPRGDGTGPRGGSGPGTGRGMGGGGRGAGRMGSGNRAGADPYGECVCPGCGACVPHQRGVPCYQVSCPQCNTAMVRR